MSSGERCSNPNCSSAPGVRLNRIIVREGEKQRVCNRCGIYFSRNGSFKASTSLDKKQERMQVTTSSSMKRTRSAASTSPSNHNNRKNHNSNPLLSNNKRVKSNVTPWQNLLPGEDCSSARGTRISFEEYQNDSFHGVAAPEWKEEAVTHCGSCGCVDRFLCVSRQSQTTPRRMAASRLHSLLAIKTVAELLQQQMQQQQQRASLGLEWFQSSCMALLTSTEEGQPESTIFCNHFLSSFFLGSTESKYHSPCSKYLSSSSSSSSSASSSSSSIFSSGVPSPTVSRLATDEMQSGGHPLLIDMASGEDSMGCLMWDANDMATQTIAPHAMSIGVGSDVDLSHIATQTLAHTQSM